MGQASRDPGEGADEALHELPGRQLVILSDLPSHLDLGDVAALITELGNGENMLIRSHG